MGGNAGKEAGTYIVNGVRVMGTFKDRAREWAINTGIKGGLIGVGSAIADAAGFGDDETWEEKQSRLGK